MACHDVSSHNMAYYGVVCHSVAFAACKFITTVICLVVAPFRIFLNAMHQSILEQFRTTATNIVPISFGRVLFYFIFNEFHAHQGSAHLIGYKVFNLLNSKIPDFVYIFTLNLLKCALIVFLFMDKTLVILLTIIWLQNCIIFLSWNRSSAYFRPSYHSTFTNVPVQIPCFSV